MKNGITLVTAFSFVVLLSCQDPKDEVSAKLPDVSLYKTVGMKIPTETGARWIQAYNSVNNISARTEGVLYSVDKTDLEQSLASVNNLTGMAFHYALDESGTKHIVLIPVDNSLRLWSNLPGRIYTDANTSTVISKGTAETWTENYKNANPDAIWFHYFGRNVFDEILTDTGFAALDIMPALNDLDLSPQLLLIVGNPDNLLGRTETETNVYDASYPCPKCEVQ